MLSKSLLFCAAAKKVLADFKPKYRPISGLRGESLQQSVAALLNLIYNSEAALLQAFKADVVLAPYEAVCSDANLQAIAWNLIIVDERKRMRSAQSKTYDTLVDFEAQHRLVVFGSASSQVLIFLVQSWYHYFWLSCNCEHSVDNETRHFQHTRPTVLTSWYQSA